MATTAPGRVSHGFVRDAWIAARFVWGHPSNRGQRLSVLARAIAFQVRGRLRHRASIVPCGARSHIVVSPAMGASGLVYANPLEVNEIAAWRRLLEPGDLFVDVGAHVGSYSIWAIEAGAEVVAVEPDPDAADALRRNLHFNGYRAHVIQAAVSDRGGVAEFTIGQGVLNHLTDGGEPSRSVETVTIDEVLGERHAAGVKIDVEGAEGLALRGAQRALLEGRIGTLQLEWNPQSVANFGHGRDDVAAWLARFGYRLFRPDRDGVLHPVEHLAPGPDVFAQRPATDAER